MSSRWLPRILLVLLLTSIGILIAEREATTFTAGTRQSYYRSKSNATLTYPHVGKLSSFRLPQKQLARTSPLEWLNFDKKVNTFTFTFYNWYYFELEFTDLTYESYVTFKIFVEDQLHDRWTQRLGFRLDQSFYPEGGNIRSNKSCCGKCSKDRGMNFDINNHVFNLTVRQHTIKNMSDLRHDGYQYGRFWYYTPNRTLDDPENEAFKEDKTVTTFNLTYNGAFQKLQANLTHVLRHNQCFSFLDEQTGAFKHNCVGGYANGRLFVDRKIRHKQLTSYDKVVKSAYNLDNNRTRSSFFGVRSTNALNKKLGNSIFKTNWKWNGFRAFAQCFSKPEYYSKKEQIEKERYVGLHFARPFADVPVQNFQDYIFYNGKLVPVHNVDYKLNEQTKKHKNITFKSTPSQGGKAGPEFQFNFTVLSHQNYNETTLISNRNELRTYGFWSGYIDEGKTGERVNFFNISGFIQTTNSLY